MIKPLRALLLAAAFLAKPAFAQVFDGGLPPGGTPDSTWRDKPVAVATAAPVAAAPHNVILLMFDGVRWQEFLHNHPDAIVAGGDKAPTFPAFWSTLAKQGVVYEHMTISNRAELSMPAYHSIFAGSTQPCRNNECGRVSVETFPERLVREGFAKEQVATFASWEGIAFAVEHVTGATTVDAGTSSHQTRLDKDTFPPALSYLKEKKPRFLFISLNDADEQGHEGHYDEYLAALRRYDGWMTELIATLDGMGDYGKNTTLLVTTDHGRGILWDWRNHGSRPWARRVWLYARTPGQKATGLTVSGREHVDIRPTIETLLGFTPQGAGRALDEAVAP